MRWDEIAEVVQAARANNRDVTQIRVGIGVYAEWRREMERRATYGYVFDGPPLEQSIYGVPFTWDLQLAPWSVEFEGL